MYFFVDKLWFVRKRYDALRAECAARGFMQSAVDKWPVESLVEHSHLYFDYAPADHEIKLNLARIIEQSPADTKYFSSPAHIMHRTVLSGDSTYLYGHCYRIRDIQHLRYMARS